MMRHSRRTVEVGSRAPSILRHLFHLIGWVRQHVSPTLESRMPEAIQYFTNMQWTDGLKSRVNTAPVRHPRMPLLPLWSLEHNPGIVPQLLSSRSEGHFHAPSTAGCDGREATLPKARRANRNIQHVERSTPTLT